MDRVYGYPNVNAKEGAVVIVYGTGAVVDWDRDKPGVLGTGEANTFFGDSVAAGDVDGDGYDDLVVGSPGDNVLYTDSGSISILYGSASGITATSDQLIHRNSTGIDATPQSYDNFGEFVAVADFDCDGYEDVAVGVPQDNAQSGRTDDGSINVIYGSSSGLSTNDDFYHQGVANVSGAPESHDQFGGAFAVGNYNGDTALFGGRECMDLAVGLPGEGNDEGFVVFFYGNYFSDFTFANQTGLSQNTTGSTDDGKQPGDTFGGMLWTFDENGDAEDDLIVGIPGEVCSNGRDAGFQQFRGTPNGFVTSQTLNDTWDYFQCLDWDAVEIDDLMTEYDRCVDFSEPGCGEDFTTNFVAQDRDEPIERLGACLAGIELALDACEHWLTDPICDEALCIAASWELLAIADGCELEGDVFTHAY